MTSPLCKHFEYCNASLCPLDKESLEHGIFYPDEAICRKRGIDWVNKQKKIIKIKANPNYYFDLNMLKRIKHVCPGIKGDDPDRPIKDKTRPSKNRLD